MNTLARVLLGLGLVLSVPSLAACGSDSASSANGHDGTYTGTYTGDATGSVKLVVQASGSTQVTANVGGKDYSGSAAVNGDKLSLGLGLGAGEVVTFDGTFSGSKISGTWSSTAGTKGTWSASK